MRAHNSYPTRTRSPACAGHLQTACLCGAHLRIAPEPNCLLNSSNVPLASTACSSLATAGKLSIQVIELARRLVVTTDSMCQLINKDGYQGRPLTDCDTSNVQELENVATLLGNADPPYLQECPASPFLLGQYSIRWMNARALYLSVSP